jgi:hypothetical protein
MHARTLRCLLAAAMVAGTLPAAAADSQADHCTLPGEGADPLADRAGILAQYEQLPPTCLQAIVNVCTAAASESLLDFGTAAACSFGYEALLKQRFGGNFRALMAWWRGQRGEAVQ